MQQDYEHFLFMILVKMKGMNKMNVRVKFSKYGAMKFIGHLDVMRFFQKVIRRAEFDVAYSNGFNPHQVMSFASPLGVGLTSDGEYLDVELNTLEDKESMIRRFNEQMPDGFLVTDLQVIPDPLPQQRRETAMSLVAAADYLVSVKDGYEFIVDGKTLSNEEFEAKIKEFLEKDSITVLKKSKKSERELDIKPFIYGFGVNESEFLQSTSSFPRGLGLVHADHYENGKQVFLQLSAGSVTNIKPELIIEAFCNSIGVEYNPFAYQIHRMDMFADISRRGMTQVMIENATAEGTLPEKQLVSLLSTNE